MPKPGIHALIMEYQDVFAKRGAEYSEASLLFPHVRHKERQILIDLLEINEKNRVLDIPAGSGFLASGIHQQFPTISPILCAEAVAEFYQFLPNYVRHCNFGLQQFDLNHHCIDRIGSLAGLHHTQNKLIFFKEAFRVLKPKGIIAVADVAINTPPAIFLNGFVNRYSSLGHKGYFFEPGELTALLTNAGFNGITEKVYHYTWDYPDDNTMLKHIKMLFGIDKADTKSIELALRDQFKIIYDKNGVHLGWSLVYAKANHVMPACYLHYVVPACF